MCNFVAKELSLQIFNNDIQKICKDCEEIMNEPVDMTTSKNPVISRPMDTPSYNNTRCPACQRGDTTSGGHNCIVCFHKKNLFHQFLLLFSGFFSIHYNFFFCCI